MDTAELVISLNQMLSTADRLSFSDVSRALAENISVFAKNLERMAEPRPLGKSWSPWWQGLSEERFKEFVRAHLREAGSSADRVKRSIETVANLRGIPIPTLQLSWVDQVAQETGGNTGA